MEYGDIVTGRFVERPNRFIAMVEIDGAVRRCHVKNTGRCRELLIKGCDVVLHRPPPSARATEYDLIAVYKGDMLVNIDSQAPNTVAAESIADVIGPVDLLRREYTFGDSRIDIYAESGGIRHLVEVKGVTLEDNGTVLFPDAPTERGVKHVNELIHAAEDGYRACILFVVQMEGADHFEPNYAMHREFGEALERAAASGVEIRAFACRVNPDSISLAGEMPVVLGHSR